MLRFSRDKDDLDDSALVSDVAFNKHSKNPDREQSPLPQGRLDIGTDGISVRLIQGIDEESFRRVLSLSVRATTGVDPDAPLDDPLWEEMLKGGLQSALESQVVIFLVTGVSRTCTHQLVRTRKAAFHQQSQRATYMGDEPSVRMPESIFRNPRVREAFRVATEIAHTAYRIAAEEDISYQDARFILPEGTETQILCEYPIREFLATYAYRACTMFQWEVVTAFREMGRLLVEAHPWLEPYVKISCEKIQRCTFQGWERVEGQCDFPWAKEELRTFRPDPRVAIS
jgi:thymidylate synthase (FAD)